jgi:hypothetical protein
MPGPVPKRSDERIRRNEDIIPVDKVEVYGDVVVPPLNMPFDPHPLVVDFYDGLVMSAQSRFYESSDWEYARIACFILQTIVTSARPSPEMFKAWQTATSNLLVTEGDRRRLRIEIARQPKNEAAVDESEALVLHFKERMEKAEAARSSA